LRLADEEGADLLAPAAPRFTGRLIVLVDASNSSATFEFAARVQRHRLGTLVGEPTGGNQRGINGGAFFFLRLPATGIEVDIPIIGLYPPGRRVDGVRDGGLVPDVEIAVTAADLARGHDAALAAARALR
jgi:C-terminal processing protease CtpA/Prc